MNTPPDAPASAAHALHELCELLASDGFAITFQSLAGYRAAVLRAGEDYRRQFPVTPCANSRPT